MSGPGYDIHLSDHPLGREDAETHRQAGFEEGYSAGLDEGVNQCQEAIDCAYDRGVETGQDQALDKLKALFKGVPGEARHPDRIPAIDRRQDQILEMMQNHADVSVALLKRIEDLEKRPNPTATAMGLPCQNCGYWECLGECEED